MAEIALNISSVLRHSDLVSVNDSHRVFSTLIRLRKKTLVSEFLETVCKFAFNLNIALKSRSNRIIIGTM